MSSLKHGNTSKFSKYKLFMSQWKKYKIFCKEDFCDIYTACNVSSFNVRLNLCVFLKVLILNKCNKRIKRNYAFYEKREITQTLLKN